MFTVVTTYSLHFAPKSTRCSNYPQPRSISKDALLDGNGNIKPDGLYNMKIRIYSALTVGTLLATETRDGSFRVQVTNGLFSIQIGDILH